MEQYIPKAALVAEIKRLRERFIAFHHRDGNDWSLDNYGKMRAYNEVLSFLDTLEVKEVDLDKSLTGFMGRYAYENGGEYPSAIDIAKHFYELGLSVSNKAQKGK